MNLRRRIGYNGNYGDVPFTSRFFAHIHPDGMPPAMTANVMEYAGAELE